MLPELANAIQREHDAAMHAAGEAIRHGIECGRLLAAAKAQVPHGQWLPWLKANTAVSHRTAQRWMRYADNSERLLNAPRVSFLTFADADRLLATPRPAAGDPQIAEAVGSILEALAARGPDPGLSELMEMIAEIADANAARDWTTVITISRRFQGICDDVLSRNAGP